MKTTASRIALRLVEILNVSREHSVVSRWEPDGIDRGANAIGDGTHGVSGQHAGGNRVLLLELTALDLLRTNTGAHFGYLCERNHRG
jgi:hypothetical protein